MNCFKSIILIMFQININQLFIYNRTKLYLSKLVFLKVWIHFSKPGLDKIGCILAICRSWSKLFLYYDADLFLKSNIFSLVLVKTQKTLWEAIFNGMKTPRLSGHCFVAMGQRSGYHQRKMENEATLPRN